MKYFALISSLFICMLPAAASEVDGYIINKTGDTVRGKIEISFKKDAVFSKKELDLGDMEYSVEFAENGAKAKKYKAGEIDGFGFNYSEIWFDFVVLDMEKNTWKKNKKDDWRIFLHRAVDGAVPVYKDYNNYKTAGLTATAKPRIATNVFIYIKSADLGFVEVAPPTFNANKKLKEFLKTYLTLEEEFLKMVDEKAAFSNAEEVLKTYNDWKKRNPS